MGKFVIGATVILCLGFLLFAFPNDGAVSESDAGGLSSRGDAEARSAETDSRLETDSRPTVRDSVHATFSGEIGVKEEGDDNSGARVEEYLAVTGLDGGYAWCAAFVAWGLTEHEVENPKSAWSPDWFPEGNTIYSRGGAETQSNWKEADVIGIYFQSKGRIAHVGVVDTVTQSFVITIEGNTNDSGSREGDRVMRKKRVKRQVYKVSNWILN